MHAFRLFILFLIFSGSLYAQSDKEQLSNTNVFSKDTLVKKDSIKKAEDLKKHIPKIATRRSAILPGWGQAYNKQYWKIPVVYGILAIPTVAYLYNNSMYKKARFAYDAMFKAQVPMATAADSVDYFLIDPQFKGLSITSTQSYRNAFRRDRDYSILWFILAWGLQVADATVFAHLKHFDVSNDLDLPSLNSTQLGCW